MSHLRAERHKMARAMAAMESKGDSMTVAIKVQETDIEQARRQARSGPCSCPLHKPVPVIGKPATHDVTQWFGTEEYQSVDAEATEALKATWKCFMRTFSMMFVVAIITWGLLKLWSAQ